MDDSISRLDAIEAIASRDETNGTVKVFTGRQVNEILESLPSADRPRGEWIDNGDRYYRCSLCGTRDTDTWDWCHGCGCRMKGADDEA